MNYQGFFWLHIKKSAGISTRAMLQPYYKEVDRTDWPPNFLQSEPECYNDILNNYRMILGKYQFQRSLFAKEVLYGNDWHKRLSFAFAREPLDRCLSMFYYLYWKGGGAKRFIKSAWKMSNKTGQLHYSTRVAFDHFLGHIQQSQQAANIHGPLGSHFSTHTNSMWRDVSDNDGNVLLNRIYRLESLVGSLNQVFEECRLPKRISQQEQDRLATTNNKTKFKGQYQPIRSQKARIEALYEADFELYEKAISC